MRIGENFLFPDHCVEKKKSRQHRDAKVAFFVEGDHFFSFFFLFLFFSRAFQTHQPNQFQLQPTNQVVLDLDETLVAAYPEPAPRAPRSWRKGPSPTLVVGNVDLGDGRSGDVRCYMRPGLHAFLEGVREIADVVLYTAGLPGYASPLCDALDPSRSLLPVRLFRATTVAAGGHSCVKDLTPLGRDLRRTVLVDNSPFSFLLQPACGLPAHPFDGDGADDHLLSSILPLLRQLAADPTLDVRPLLSAKFGMASWLAARGGWALYEAPCGNLAVATGYCAPSSTTPVQSAPSTPERQGKSGFVLENEEEDDDGEEFEELSHSSSSSFRPSTPTTPLQQAPSSGQQQRYRSAMRPMGAVESVDLSSPEEEERMMAIEVAA